MLWLLGFERFLLVFLLVVFMRKNRGKVERWSGLLLLLFETKERWRRESLWGRNKNWQREEKVRVGEVYAYSFGYCCFLVWKHWGFMLVVSGFEVFRSEFDIMVLGKACWWLYRSNSLWLFDISEKNIQQLLRWTEKNFVVMINSHVNLIFESDVFMVHHCWFSVWHHNVNFLHYVLI